MSPTTEPLGPPRRTSFDELALQEIDALYRYACRLSRNNAIAEDLVQETFLKAYRAWDRFTPGTNIRAWLFTILRNTFFNNRRDLVHRNTIADIALVSPTTSDALVAESDPEKQFFDQLVDEEVMQAIDALTTIYREVIVLRDMEGLTYEEVGKVLGIRVGTVKSRLFRARAALRQQLFEYASLLGYVN